METEDRRQSKADLEQAHASVHQRASKPVGAAHKPCAHCGSVAELRVAMDEYWAKCLGCGAAIGGHHRTEESAWAAWDRRTTRSDWAQMLVYAANHQLDVLQDILTLQDDSAIEALAKHAHADLSAAIGRARREQEGGGA